jgi:hypothetical protein
MASGSSGALVRVGRAEWREALATGGKRPESRTTTCLFCHSNCSMAAPNGSGSGSGSASELDVESCDACVGLDGAWADTVTTLVPGARKSESAKLSRASWPGDDSGDGKLRQENAEEEEDRRVGEGLRSPVVAFVF